MSSTAIEASSTAGGVTGSTTPGPQSIKPTGTDSATIQSIPSSIVVQPSNTNTASQTTSAAALIPSGQPLIIAPPGDPRPQPANTTLIQIGFNYSLNYEFVLEHSVTQRQIFQFLPNGIAYDLGINPTQVVMQRLQADNSTVPKGFFTTLAMAFIPADMVNRLKLDLLTPPSKIYRNPDGSTNTLMSMINPSFNILANQPTGDGLSGTNTNGNAAASSSAAAGDGSPLGANMNNSSSVKGTSVGIGVGVVAGAAAYGAAMFFVARRYKRKRQGHYRSRSLIDTGDMVQSSGGGVSAALMSGGRGDGWRSVTPGYDGRDSRNSGRSGSTRAQISAPVMAENSLGWN